MTFIERLSAAVSGSKPGVMVKFTEWEGFDTVPGKGYLIDLDVDGGKVTVAVYKAVNAIRWCDRP